MQLSCPIAYQQLINTLKDILIANFSTISTTKAYLCSCLLFYLIQLILALIQQFFRLFFRARIGTITTITLVKVSASSIKLRLLPISIPIIIIIGLFYYIIALITRYQQPQNQAPFPYKRSSKAQISILYISFQRQHYSISTSISSTIVVEPSYSFIYSVKLNQRNQYYIILTL